MEHISSFEGGLYQDNNPLNQPKNTYTNCRNGVLLSQNGDIMSIAYESGNEEVNVGIPAGFKLIGHTILQDDIIVFLVDDTNNYSQIGVIDATNTYTRIAPSTDTSNEFNFSINNPVDAVARLLITGERVVYFTDNLNPFRKLSLDNPPDDVDLVDDSRLIKNVSLPTFKLQTVIDGAGNLNAGAYQFVTRYKDSNLTPTTFGIPSNPIYLVDESFSAPPNQVDGASPDTLSGKNIVIDIEDVDTSQAFLDIALLYYEGNSSTARTVIVDTVQIQGDTVSYTLSNIPENSVPLVVDEILREPTSYGLAKCIEQKDNRLFLSNLQDNTGQFDTELQDVANNIRLGYKIKTLAYDPTSPVESEDNAVSDLQLVTTFYDDTDSPASPPADGTITLAFIYRTTVTEALPENFTLRNTGLLTDYGINPSNFQNTVGFSFTAVTPVVTITDVAVEVSFTHPDFEGLVFNPADWEFAQDNVVIREVIDGENVDTLVPQQEGQLDFSANDIEEDSDIGSIGLSAYKNPLVAEEFKGYRRGEVYSFGFGVIYKDGTTSPVYHIPGFDTSPTNATPDFPGVITGETEGWLGTYLSTEPYPTGQGFPIGNIRHHLMPTLGQEPHYQNVTGSTSIRVLGLKAQFNTPLSINLQSSIQGYFICRERRNRPENRSIFAQGMIHHMQESTGGVNDDNNGSGEYTLGGGLTSDPFGISGNPKFLQKVPTHNNFQFNVKTLRVENISNIGAISNRPSSKTWFSNPIKDIIAFIGPEVILNNGSFLSPENVLGGSLIQELDITSSGNDVKYGIGQNSIFTNKKTRYGLNPFAIIESGLTRQLTLYDIANYNDLSVPASFPEYGINVADYVANSSNSIKPDILPNTTIRNYDGVLGYNQYLILKTDSDVTEANANSFVLSYQSRHNFRFLTGNSDSNADVSGNRPTSITNSLFNLKQTNLSQYGGLNSKPYILVKIVKDTNPTLEEEVYGGDTYISKFSYVNREVIDHRNSFIEGTETTPSVRYSSRGATSANTVEPFSGIEIRSLRYFFVESDINCDLRHAEEDEEGNSLDYFPKNLDYGQVCEEPLDPTNYNTQYSFENAVKPFFSKGIAANSTQFNFPYRTIYSQKSVEDQLSDNYSIFLQENFHDISGNTGEIWDTFIHNNVFFIHTPKALWQTSVNERTALQAQTTDDVILGTGGMFPYPSKQVFTADGGYAGTISQFGSVHTPFGYVFPDLLQGKVFVLGQGLEEISQIGMLKFFSSIDEQKANTYLDNPYNNLGVCMGYDYDNKRLLYTKHADNKTLSFSFLNRKWVSFHDYLPNAYISLNNDFWIAVNNDKAEFYNQNQGAPGVFFGSQQPFDFEYIVNQNPLLSKTFDNMMVVLDEVGDTQIDFFDRIRVQSDFNDSTLLPLNITNVKSDGNYVRVRNVNNEYRLAIPRAFASVKQERIKGKYAKVFLSYGNDIDSNKRIVLLFATSFFRQNSR